MVAVALGVGAALCWGLADFLGGLRARRVELAAVLVVSQVTGLAAAAAVLAIDAAPAPSAPDLVPAAAAGLCQIVGIAALYYALAIGNMTLVSPVSASGAALLPVAVAAATGELPEAVQAAGMAAALAGVVLATRGGESAARPDPRSLTFALVAALGIGGFFVGMDAAVDRADPFWALLVARAAAVVVLLAGVLVLRRGLSVSRPELPSLALIGLLDVGANACFTFGTETGLLSVVAVLASLYPVGTVLLARGVLGERLRPAQLAGVTVALAGVALMAAG